MRKSELEYIHEGKQRRKHSGRGTRALRITGGFETPSDEILDCQGEAVFDENIPAGNCTQY